MSLIARHFSYNAVTRASLMTWNSLRFFFDSLSAGNFSPKWAANAVLSTCTTMGSESRFEFEFESYTHPKNSNIYTQKLDLKLTACICQLQ